MPLTDFSISNKQVLKFISYHKTSFDIGYIYPLDLFERFATINKLTMVECSCKVKQNIVYPMRFDISLFGSNYAQKFNHVMLFFQEINSRVGVNLNLEWLTTFFDRGFKFSAILGFNVAIDLRTELKDSRIKLLIGLNNQEYPEKVETALKSCGLESQQGIRTLLIHSSYLVIGFDLYLDGRYDSQLDITLKPDVLQNTEVHQYLLNLISASALRPVPLCNEFAVSFSQMSKDKAIYYDLKNLDDFSTGFSNCLRLSEVSKTIHSIYRSHSIATAMGVVVSDNEFRGDIIQNFNLKYRIYGRT
ncbi:LynF/TruF/PatF family peptide O-prenyltransferase [Nostoc sp.]|uniref:LynF/TruF/PatF family peptide O-prenyltransferase n=1 Tax=Nostoc sp. TaxID=1180 RepID=UPI002FF1174C